MVAITDYNTLVQAVKDLAEDDSDEFVSYIDTAISLAEDKLLKELELPELIFRETGTLSISDKTVSKPVGYKLMKSFTINISGNVKTKLKRRTYTFLEDYWPDDSAVAEPKYYSDYDSTNFIIAPTPNNSYTYNMVFVKAPTKLSSSNLTNYFTDKCANVLFAAVMLEMFKFMKAWNQTDVWRLNYTEEKDSWNLLALRQRRDDGETPMRMEGGSNIVRSTLESNG